MATQVADMIGIRLVELSKQTYVSKRDLCVYCGNTNDCKDKRSIRATWRSAERNNCIKFSPILTFRPPLKGLTGTFNTFRIGRAWFNRLHNGRIVHLMDASNQKVIGRARVVLAHVGPKEAMCELHGSKNHLLIGEDNPNPGTAMLKILRSVYGKQIFEANTDVSVIYLERMRGGSTNPRGKGR